MPSDGTARVSMGARVVRSSRWLTVHALGLASVGLILAAPVAAPAQRAASVRAAYELARK